MIFRLAGGLVNRDRFDEAERILETLRDDYADVIHPLGSNSFAKIIDATLRRARMK